MSRPADGCCSQCHRPLPREENRDWLTQGTELCAKCGHNRARQEAKMPIARAYFATWLQALDTHRRLVASVKMR